MVGFTGAGANRLFSALTSLPAPSEYEAGVGVATVPDERLDRLTEMSHSVKRVPAGFELVHLALTPGATPGEGLGARLLGSLRNCEAILVVLKANASGGVTPDPIADLTNLELEFVMTDAETVESRLARQRRTAKGDKSLLPEIAALERALDVLSAGDPIARSNLTPEERALLAPCFLLTLKPLLVVCNTGENLEADDTVSLPEGAITVPIDLEAEIAAIDPEARAEMRESYGIAEPALDRVAHAAYRLLGLSTTIHLPVRSIFSCTANNPTLSTEMARR